MKKYLKELGKDDIEVMSAGVHAIDGLGPTQETIDVMKEEGIGVSGFLSHALTAELAKRADLILVMTGVHMCEVVANMPEASKKVHILKQFGVEHETRLCRELDIPDPIGMDKDFYKEVLSTIKKEMKRITGIL